MTPNKSAKAAETSKQAICRPPCFRASELRAGVLPFLPAQKMALKIPERMDMNKASKG